MSRSLDLIFCDSLRFSLPTPLPSHFDYLSRIYVISCWDLIRFLGRWWDYYWESFHFLGVIRELFEKSIEISTITDSFENSWLRFHWKLFHDSLVFAFYIPDFPLIDFRKFFRYSFLVSIHSVGYYPRNEK